MRRNAWVLQLFGVWALVAVHPVLDLLGRSPEFFVAHGAGARELALMLAVLMIPVPLVLVLLVRAAGIFGDRGRQAVLAALIGILTGLFGLQLANAAGLTTWKVAGPIAVCAAVAVALLYARIAPLRTFFSILGLAVVAVPAAFLLKSGVRRLVIPPPEPIASVAPPDAGRFRPAPVVFVLFDELPLISLLDASRHIDAELYPHIAALAADGRWFRNATAVSDYTQWALPSMLTGRYPRRQALPIAADHPMNLFTLLGRTHRLQVVEAITSLCPERLCPGNRTPVAERLTGMASDIRYLWLHVTLPEELRRGLPPLTNDWANFDQDGWRRERRRRRAERHRGRPDKRQVAEAFIERIDARGSQPAFYYLHSLLTHFPHELLPSGQRNATRAALPGEIGTSWSTDRWAVAQHYQRHLLQVGHADTVVGELVRRLRAAGLYHRALIVLASDHGSAYTPGAPRRAFTATTAAEIVRVPLIIKLPDTMSWPPAADGRPEESHIDDRNAETIDIAPTVADVLGLDGWDMDGRSLLDLTGGERRRKRIMFASGSRVESHDAAWPDVKPALERKLEIFGGAENPFRIPRPDRFAALIGRAVSELRVTGGTAHAGLSHASAYRSVDRRAANVPFDVSGVLKDGPDAYPAYIAVAVNGRIAAVTRTWDSAPDAFSATPPPSFWRDGANELELFVVSQDRSGPRLEGVALN